MPTKAVVAENMGTGRKGGGKHWTDAEVAARQKAAEAVKRRDSATLKAPGWLNKRAGAIWKEKIAQVNGLNAANDLLDVLDTETLALYCHAVAEYETMAAAKNKTIDDVKAMQSWMRLIGSYAEKLGFNPSARARLVKKLAGEGNEDPFGKFD